jgi:hypothetical protein
MQRNDGKGYYPFTDDCLRHENGIISAGPGGTIGMRGNPVQTCKGQFETACATSSAGIRDRRFVAVDRERGIVFAFAAFDHRNINWTWELGELFKIEHNQIRRIEAIFIRGPYGVCSGWGTTSSAARRDPGRSLGKFSGGGTGMIRKHFSAGLWPAPRRRRWRRAGPPPSPYAPLQDRPTCTRDELKAATAAYVEAQRTGNLAGLPLDEKAHFLENMITVERGAGLWNTALPIANSMSFHDDKRCKTFTEIIVTEGGPPVRDRHAAVPAPGQGDPRRQPGDRPGRLAVQRQRLPQVHQDRGLVDLFKYQKTPPSEIIRGANAYLDGFADKFTDIPWGTPCARLEGGAYTNRSGDRTRAARSGCRRACCTSSTATTWSTRRRA